MGRRISERTSLKNAPLEAPEAPPSRLRRWLEFMLCLLAFYLLALGPIAGMSRNDRLVENADKWAKMLYRPLLALEAGSPLRKPLDWYMDWWTDMVKPETES